MSKFYKIAKPGLLDNVVVHENFVREYNATAAILLSNIYFLCVRHGKCTQSILSMSYRTGISRNTVRRYLKLFISKQLINKVSVDGHLSDYYELDKEADVQIVRAYEEMISKKKKSADSGALISINLKKLKAAKGKQAEKQRFLAFFTSYCVDRFASNAINSEANTGFFTVPSINKFAKQFGITRQTLSKVLKILKQTSKLKVEYFEGNTIIDFLSGLNQRIKTKQALIAKSLFT